MERCSDVVDYQIAYSNWPVFTEESSLASNEPESELTATEALHPRKITTGPEWWTVSLTRGEGRSRRSGWLACAIQPACNWSHFKTHLPG